MAIHNTSYDAANTAVRAFLTKVGAIYWGKTFNTNSGNGKYIWAEIKDVIFVSKCAYCATKSDKLQIEHVIMFNREEYGLHHPGNVAPVCSSCNTRSFGNDGKHVSWIIHLKNICEQSNNLKEFEIRKQKIEIHISKGKYAYPKLSETERKAIRVIAETLYLNIIKESDNALNLYGKISEAFVSQLHSQ